MDYELQKIAAGAATNGSSDGSAAAAAAAIPSAPAATPSSTSDDTAASVGKVAAIVRPPSTTPSVASAGSAQSSGGGAGNSSAGSTTPVRKRRTWKKPKDKPKRPLSAYNLFFKHERQRIVAGKEDHASPQEIIQSIEVILSTSRETRRHRKTHGRISFSDLARKIAEKWKSIPPQQKAVFDHYAELDMKRYRRDVKTWKEKKENEAFAAANGAAASANLNGSMSSLDNSVDSEFGFDAAFQQQQQQQQQQQFQHSSSQIQQQLQQPPVGMLGDNNAMEILQASISALLQGQQQRQQQLQLQQQQQLNGCNPPPQQQPQPGQAQAATSLLSASVQSQLASSLRNQPLAPQRSAAASPAASAAAAAAATAFNRQQQQQHPKTSALGLGMAATPSDAARYSAALRGHISHKANASVIDAATDQAAANLRSLTNQAINFASRSVAADAISGRQMGGVGAAANYLAAVEPQAPKIGATDMKMPCQARGMPADHNSSTAYFVVPASASHGQHLFCSYPSCKAAGVKFRLCKYCMKPVTKQNFKSRHDHADLAKKQQQEQQPSKSRNSGLASGSGHKKRDDMNISRRPSNATANTSASSPQKGAGRKRKVSPTTMIDAEGTDQKAPAASTAMYCRPVSASHGTAVGKQRPSAVAAAAQVTNRDLSSSRLDGVSRKRRWTALQNERPANMRNFGQWVQNIIDVSDNSIPHAAAAAAASDEVTPSVSTEGGADPATTQWTSLLGDRPSVGVDGDAMNDWLIQVLKASKTTSNGAEQEDDDTLSLPTQQQQEQKRKGSRSNMKEAQKTAEKEGIPSEVSIHKRENK